MALASFNDTTTAPTTTTTPLNALLSSSGPPAPASPSLLDMFGNSGQSPLLITIVGIRWCIAAVGTPLNLLLVWVTIRNK